MIIYARHRPVLALLAIFAILITTGCTIRHEIVGEGKSEAHITITTKFKFKIKPTQDITFPDNFFIEQLRGLTLGAGSCFEVELEPGEIVLEDKVKFGGESAIENAVETTRRGVIAPDLANKRTTPINVRPAATTTFSGTVDSGSTYTWIIPALFGDAKAAVPVTGTIDAKAHVDALVENDDGTWSLRSGGLISFAYRVTGPPAVWELPIVTPMGVWPGKGHIETEGWMVFEATSDVGSISGSGGDGYSAPNGTAWEHGYIGSFPVRLTVAGDRGIGATSVDGGFDLY